MMFFLWFIILFFFWPFLFNFIPIEWAFNGLLAMAIAHSSVVPSSAGRLINLKYATFPSASTELCFMPTQKFCGSWGLAGGKSFYFNRRCMKWLRRDANMHPHHTTPHIYGCYVMCFYGAMSSDHDPSNAQKVSFGKTFLMFWPLFCGQKFNWFCTQFWDLVVMSCQSFYSCFQHRSILTRILFIPVCGWVWVAGTSFWFWHLSEL